MFGSADMSSSTCVLAIKLTNEGGQRLVGVAYADACMRRLEVAEFIDNDQFSNVEVGGPQETSCVGGALFYVGGASLCGRSKESSFCMVM